MIRIKQIKTYKSFSGDIDEWARMKKPSDTMTDNIWFQIESMLQNLKLIKDGVASEEFATETLQHVKIACESQEVEQELIDLSNM